MRCEAEVKRSLPYMIPRWQYHLDSEGRVVRTATKLDIQCKKNALDGSEFCGLHQPEAIAARKRASLAHRNDSPLRGEWRVTKSFHDLMQWDRSYLKDVFGIVADA